MIASQPMSRWRISTILRTMFYRPRRTITERQGWNLTGLFTRPIRSIIPSVGKPTGSEYFGRCSIWTSVTSRAGIVPALVSSLEYPMSSLIQQLQCDEFPIMEFSTIEFYASGVLHRVHRVHRVHHSRITTTPEGEFYRYRGIWQCLVSRKESA